MIIYWDINLLKVLILNKMSLYWDLLGYAQSSILSTNSNENQNVIEIKTNYIPTNVRLGVFFLQGNLIQG
jgi:hypothetical protein